MSENTAKKLLFYIIAGLMAIALILCYSLATMASDYTYLDSTFRAMEKRAGGGSVDFKNRIFVIDRNVNLPKIGADNKTKTFNISNLTVKGGGLMARSNDWNDEHNYQTNRTFKMSNVNVYSADIGMVIQGSHRSIFENVSFWGCRKGGSFELCLEGYAVNLQAHQCRDTGVYIGYSTLQGCTNSNSQSNNFRVNGFRSYGTGSGIALIYHGVSGGVVTNLTDEGGGHVVFLLVNASGSNFMKDFRATNFHIETKDSKCVIDCRPNGSKFYFGDFFPQVTNILIRGEGLGSIYVSNMQYIPTGGIQYQNMSGANGSLWWHFSDCESNNRSIYDDGNWVLKGGGTKPNPYSAGQTTNNSGSNRLYEIPPFTK